MATARKTPAAAEALGDRIPFEFEGESFLVTPSTEWTLDDVEAAEEGRLVAFMKAVLSDAEMTRVRALGLKGPRIGAFIEALTKGAGVQGN
jgi:hypothetical protein